MTKYNMLCWLGCTFTQIWTPITDFIYLNALPQFISNDSR